MAPQPWTTSTQQAYLALQMPDYIRRQAQKKLHLFWPPMQEGWFSRFSEHAHLGLPLPSDLDAPPLTREQVESLGEAICVRKKQLTNWFRRERNKLRSGKGGPSKTVSPLVKALAKRTQPSGRRAHQAVEVFQMRHKAEIRAELTVLGHDAMNEAARVAAKAQEGKDRETREEQEIAVKLSRSERMTLRGSVVSKLWANASEAERQEVYQEIAREKAALARTQREAEERDGTREKTTGEQYQVGVDGLDELFEGVHGIMGEAAGWVGVSLLAGPTPRMPGGEISVKVGETPAGNSFAESCVDFEKEIVQQFTQFAARVFTASDCRARAIHTAASEATEAPPAPSTPDVTVPPPSKPKRMPKPKKLTLKAPPTSGSTLSSSSVTPASCTSTTPASPGTPSPVPPSSPPPTLSFPTALTTPGALDRLGASLNAEFGADFLEGLGIGAGLYDPSADFGGDSSFGNSSFDDDFAGDSSFADDASFAGDSSLSGNSFGGDENPFVFSGPRDSSRSGGRWLSTPPTAALTPPPPFLRPVPRPSYIGASFYNAAGPDTGPLSTGSIYAPGAMLAAFTKTTTPMVSAPASMRRKATAWASPSKAGSVGRTTQAALLLTSIIGGAAATPVIPSTTPAFVFPVSRPAARTPQPPVATPAVPAATPTIPPRLPIPAATPAIPPLPPIPAATPALVFPVSRPAARIPVPKVAANVKKTAPKRGIKRKAADVAAAVEEEAVALGEPVEPPKRRGRPPKPKTPAAVAPVAASEDTEGGALGDTTNTNATPARILAEKQRVIAEKAALRAENRRLHNPSGERPLDIVAVPRAVRQRTAAKFLDGTFVQLEPKLSRAEVQRRKNAASEKAMLERTGANVSVAARLSKKSIWKSWKYIDHIGAATGRNAYGLGQNLHKSWTRARVFGRHERSDGGGAGAAGREGGAGRGGGGAAGRGGVGGRGGEGARGEPGKIGRPVQPVRRRIGAPGGRGSKAPCAEARGHREEDVFRSGGWGIGRGVRERIDGRAQRELMGARRIDGGAARRGADTPGPVESLSSLFVHSPAAFRRNFNFEIIVLTPKARSSYGDFLANVMRINHPETSFSAVASAGPVRAFLPVTNDPDRFNRYSLVSQYWMDHALGAAVKMHYAASASNTTNTLETAWSKRISEKG
ncbi:hypothetical protein DFH09DRAFT_1103254 [Mycena vulgaris]|nr:hypothetical protein DFH09DRAFT_1103254 [Mycena vulgaris]